MPIDYSKYPPNWHSEIRPAVLARANNKCECENCGFANGQTVFRARINGRMEWFPSREDIYQCGLSPELADFWASKPVKVVITVAHLDHDETNHNVSLDRLRAMCQLHHLRYDAKEKYRRSLLK